MFTHYNFRQKPDKNNGQFTWRPARCSNFNCHSLNMYRRATRFGQNFYREKKIRILRPEHFCAFYGFPDSQTRPAALRINVTSSAQLLTGSVLTQCSRFPRLDLLTLYLYGLWHRVVWSVSTDDSEKPRCQLRSDLSTVKTEATAVFAYKTTRWHNQQDHSLLQIQALLYAQNLL